MAVDGRSKDRHIRMRFGEAFDALRRCQQTDETQIVGPALFQLVDRRNGGIGCGQHRIDDNHQPVGDVFRRFEIIFDGFKRIMVTVKPDMGDTG